MADLSGPKTKSAKTNHPESRTTLDALHSQKVTELVDEKRNIQQSKAQIAALNEIIQSSTSDMELWAAEQQRDRLVAKVNEIETGGALMNYYLRSGNILFNYYDVQENIQRGTNRGGAMKSKPGSILAILNDIERGGPKATQAAGPSVQAPLQRNELMNQYLLNEDPAAARLDTSYDDEWTHCDGCGHEMSLCMNEATMTCVACGHKEFILIDSDKPSYKDPPRELSYYAYKKINHFNEWLAQFQAKESTEIPSIIYDQILLQLKKERITNFSSLKRTKLREILRHMGETKYYEHIPHIINRLSGQNAPFMSREDEEKLRHMFREIQPAFKKHIPKGRRNFLSYGYILYKFCELLEMDEHLACFPLLKNRDKLYIQDQAWKGICSDMQWQYIRTV
jgi:DNA-directed RNA polymerase subunit RPC12/RpoP